MTAGPGVSGDVPVVGAVLCGGRSRRFGSDKALADAGGRPLGLRVVEALRQGGADPVLAVGGRAGDGLGVPTLADRAPGQGPLAALATVLLWARTGLVVVAPCDLPLLTGAHVRALVDAATAGDAAGTGGRASVAFVGGGPQAMLACWPARWGPAVATLLHGGARSWRAALEAGPWDPVALPAEAVADADTPEALRLLLEPGAVPSRPGPPLPGGPVGAGP